VRSARVAFTHLPSVSSSDRVGPFQLTDERVSCGTALARALSHPQALSQCDGYLTRLGGWARPSNVRSFVRSFVGAARAVPRGGRTRRTLPVPSFLSARPPARPPPRGFDPAAAPRPPIRPRVRAASV
jgi:hypothetical protein